MIRRLLREPLTQFLLAGGALFALYGWVADGVEQHPDRIVVTEHRVASLAASFERTWMRPPTRGELERLVADFVDEEVLYREALALGLDRNDLVVRRRMRQKMEFLNEGLLETLEPTEKELRTFLEENPERFERPARMSFRQVFFEADPLGEAQARAASLLQRLRAEPELTSSGEGLGDPTLLPGLVEDATSQRIAGAFGTRFVEALEDAPDAAWSGPIASGFGLHLVLVTAREAARTPSLAEVRSSVEREWAAERREQASQRFLRELRERYQIEVRMPDDPADPALASRQP